MYLAQPRQFSPGDLHRLLQLTKCLDLAPGPGGSRMSDVLITQKVYGGEPWLQDAFRGHWTKATVVALYPSQQIPQHVDHPNDCRGIRYHVPLKLNDACWVFHDGVWQQLTLGRVYQMDPTQPHGAVNWGAEVRLHLMIDVDG